MRREQLRRWGLAIYLTGASILFLAPVSAPTGAPTYTDKIAHILLMGGLALLWWWNVEVPVWKRAFLAVGLTLAYAALIEILQGFTPSRTRELADVVAGGVGAGLAVLVLVALTRRARF